MRIYVTDDYNDNNNDEVDVDNNSQVNLHSPLTVHVSDFDNFRLHNKRLLHIFQRKHETTIILVLEDVDGQFEKPLLYFHDTASCLGCPIYNWLCPLVCWVTHSFDDPHVAPYWPTWPYYSLSNPPFPIPTAFQAQIQAKISFSSSSSPL